MNFLLLNIKVVLKTIMIRCVLSEICDVVWLS